MVAEEVFVKCYRTILIILINSERYFLSYLKKLSGAGSRASAGAGAEVAIQICVTA